MKKKTLWISGLLCLVVIALIVFSVLPIRIAFMPGGLEKFLELAGDAWLSHARANPDEKREMVRILTSNRQVSGKNLYLEPSLGFREMVSRFENADCDQQRDVPRTLDRILDDLTKLNTQGLLPDLPLMFGSWSKDTKGQISLKE